MITSEKKQKYPIDFVIEIITDVTAAQEKARLHDGKFYRWITSVDFAKQMQTTVQHAYQLLNKVVSRKLVDKKLHRFDRRTLFALKEYEGYTVDGDYFVKNT